MEVGKMRGWGGLVLVIGIVWVIAAACMDVSVSTGSGSRVNNIGLIAQQQNHLMIGGMVALGGLLMTIFGARSSSPQVQAEVTRPCPLCAEPIKYAAVKCKHCGADVEAVPTPPEPLYAVAKTGWTVEFPCRPGPDRDRVLSLLESMNLPILEGKENPTVGPFAEQSDAKKVLSTLGRKHYIHGGIRYAG
jgi:hypothetical protein